MCCKQLWFTDMHHTTQTCLLHTGVLLTKMKTLHPEFFFQVALSTKIIVILYYSLRHPISKEVHHCIHKSTLSVPNHSQTNQVQNLTSYFYTTHFIIIIQPTFLSTAYAVKKPTHMNRHLTHNWNNHALSTMIPYKTRKLVSPEN
jgi:hypothetical protein